MHCRWLQDGGFPSVHLSQGGPDASCHMWHGSGQLRAFQRFRGPAGYSGNQLPHFPFKDCYEQLPQGLVLGSETASTVSSRGTYHFPVEKAFSVKHEDHQSSGYDMEACNWSNIPDVDFALAEDYPWTLGQFVWTGFDYLASRALMIPIHGRTTVPCSESLTWPQFRRTDVGFTAASGTRKSYASYSSALDLAWPRRAGDAGLRLYFMA